MNQSYAFLLSTEMFCDKRLEAFKEDEAALLASIDQAMSRARANTNERGAALHVSFPPTTGVGFTEPVGLMHMV